jgi:hypothetical protein
MIGEINANLGYTADWAAIDGGRDGDETIARSNDLGQPTVDDGHLLLDAIVGDGYLLFATVVLL